jgi:hypothetical protein
MATKRKSDEAGNKVIEALMSGKKLSIAQQKAVREIGEHVIDEFMRAVGHPDPSRLTDQNGWRHLQLDSAQGIAGIKEVEGELYLHVEAVVMALPSDKDPIQALMRAALELNCALPGACSLGIRGTLLVASATQNLRSLRSPADFGNSIHNVMALANAIDDDFRKKYGGTTRKRKSAAVAVAV